MKRLGHTVTKNALANVVRGGASALAAIALPHFLTRALDHDHFAAWVLMLQVAAYANYLDFGLQTAVARYLAQAIELRDDIRRDQLVSTAVGLLSAAGALAFAVLSFIDWQLPHLFRSMPVQSINDVRAGLLIMAAFAAAALPLSAFTGVLIGFQRNEYPAFAIGASRIIGAIAVLVCVQYTHSLAWLAFCLGAFNLFGGFAQLFMARRLLPFMRLHFSYLQADMARELIGYCSSLTVWSIGMLLVSGLDLTVIGYFNFAAVGYYSIAVTLVSFFTGLNGSVLGAMMAPVAVLQARKEFQRIRDLIMTATQMNSYVCMALTVASLLFGEPALRLWVGPIYTHQALPILQILLAAQTVRLIGNAYGTALVAMGHQRQGLVIVVAEAGLNLLLSVTGMVLIGAAGVAWATLSAATFALVSVIFILMPRVSELAINRKQFARRAIVQPLLASLAPMIWLGIRASYVNHFQPSELGRTLPLALSLLIALWFTWTGIRSTFAGIKKPIALA